MDLQNYKILSVGGSIIIPPEGFDIDFLRQFRELILDQVTRGQKFILVIGGGGTARSYQAAGRGLDWDNTTLDWVGIAVTKLNAEFVKQLFGDMAHSAVIDNPTKKINTDKPIIIAAGWEPGCSTDNDAVLLAKTYDASELINVSNIDYVYDSDPKINLAAKRKDRLTWTELIKIVGTQWTPGANIPFDPSAAALARDLGLKVKFVRGTDLAALQKAVIGDDFAGTVIE